MQAGNRRVLLCAVALIAACIAVVVTVCVMLFSGEDDVPHIQIEEKLPTVSAGELELGLVRERLDTVTLDKRGLPVSHTEKQPKDFSRSSENIFGINSNLLVGPGCYFSAQMALSNKKPYDFEYWLEIIPVGGDNLLADQLEFTVTIGEETFIKRTLQSGLTSKAFPVVKSGQTSRITVRLEYLNVENNDDTKNITLAFDMSVHARLV